MKKSSWMLLVAGIFIGVALIGQFEPFRSWLGAIATAALFLGLILTALGLGQVARERKPR